MRFHVDDRNPFPASLVVNLSLQFSVTPRVHSGAIFAALAVALTVELPHAGQLLHGYRTLFLGCVLDYAFRDLVKKLLNAVSLSLAIFGEDPLPNAMVIPLHV